VRRKEELTSQSRPDGREVFPFDQLPR